MKVELCIPSEFVKAVADAVVERLRPMTTGLQTKPSQVDNLKGVVELGKYLGGVGSISGDKEQQDLQRALPPVGYLRLKEVLAVIPVSKSTWWAGVRTGRFPKPTKKFGRRISAWDIRDIRPLLERVAGSE